LDGPSALQPRPGQDVAGAASVAAVALAVEQAVDDVDLLPEGGQRLEAGAELHLGAGAPGPPVVRRDAIADEQAGEALRGLLCRRAGRECRGGFQPGQSDGDPQALEQQTTRNFLLGSHLSPPRDALTLNRDGVKSLQRCVRNGWLVATSSNSV